MKGRTRVILGLLIGAVAGTVAALVGLGFSGALIGWSVAAGVISVWTHVALWQMDGPATESHATEEDPPQRWTRLVLTLGALGAVGGVVVMIASASTGSAVLSAFVGIITVATTWILIHSMETLRYAHVHYSDPEGGIDFAGNEAPAYTDFAYHAFTIGMTYQVSDTTFTTRAARKIGLSHALVSFVLGVVVIAVAINVVVQVASNAAGSG